MQKYIVEQSTSKARPGWPDLALLKIDFEDHPCVLLLPEYDIGDDLYTFGYTDQYEWGDSTTAKVEGISDTPQKMKFKLGQVRPGLSGSPLLNLRTGGVCGIVQVSRDRANDLGGRAITIPTVIENITDLIILQASYHHPNGSWVGKMTSEQQSALYDVPRHIKNCLTEVSYISKEKTDILVGLFWKLHPPKTELKPYGEFKLASPRGAFIHTITSSTIYGKEIYAGTDNSQGIYKSTDGGASWTSVSAGLRSTNIHSLKISPYNNVIYAMTNSGVWTSKNQGASWEWYDNAFKNESVLCAIFSPRDPDYVAFGTQQKGGGGTSAATVTSASTTRDQPLKPINGFSGGHLHIRRKIGMDWISFSVKTVNDCLYSPNDGRVAYVASADGGLYVTRDEFETLEEVKAMAGNRPLKIAMPLDDENIVAIACLVGLFLSNDGGRSWRWCEEVGRDQVADIVFVNGRANHILAACKNGVFESTDGGQTWQGSNDGLAFRWSMAISQSDDGKVFVGTSGGGVYQRTLNRRDWVAQNSGFPASPIMSLTAGNGYLFAGGNGVYRSDDQGNSWKHMGLGGQFIYSIVAVASPPLSTQPIRLQGVRVSRTSGKHWNEVNTAKNNTIHACTNDKIYISNDNGKTWLPIASFDIKSYLRRVQRDIIVSTTVPGLLYTYHQKELLRSMDYGHTWELIGKDCFEGKSISVVKLFQMPDDCLIAICTTGEIYKSYDNGDSWVCSEAKFDNIITSIALSNDKQKLFFASPTGNVFESADKGVTFYPIRIVAQDSRIENRWAVIFAHPILEGYIILGTSAGAFRSEDGGQTWNPIFAGLLGMSYYVNSFYFYEGLLFVAMKQGIFKLIN